MCLVENKGPHLDKQDADLLFFIRLPNQLEFVF